MPKTPRNGTIDPQAAVTPWIGWMLGPLAWAMHQTTSFALTGWVCETGHYFLLYLISIGALGIAGTGLAIAWRHWRNADPSDPSAKRAIGRRRFQAAVGMMICTISLAGIAVESAGVFVLDACLGAS